MVILAEPLNDTPLIVLADCKVVAVVALPLKAAVIVPAEKFPDPSRATTLEAVLVDVASTANVLAADPLNAVPVMYVPGVNELPTWVAVVAVAAFPVISEEIVPGSLASAIVPEEMLEAFNPVIEPPVPANEVAVNAPSTSNGLLISILELPLSQVIDAFAPEINKPPPSASAVVVDPDAITTSLSLMNKSEVLIVVTVP